MHSVTILLSTYNGEKYLREQIDSVLRQKGVDISILVRDDGSKDSTLSILEEYASTYSCFSFYQGQNCGPAKSFLELITRADSADYYALCDQDDVWDEDKISIAVSSLENLDNQVPNLYYSNLRIVDETLAYHRDSHIGDFSNKNKYSALTENLCTGCTAVFNYKAKELIASHIPEYCTMHDTWLYMVCMLMGNVIYDQTAHISYRQHGGNVVGAYLEKNRLAITKEKFMRLFKRGLQPRYVNAKNFLNCFGNIITAKDKEKIEEVVNYKNSFRDRMKLFFDKEIKATTRYGNLRFRLHILWGTV